MVLILIGSSHFDLLSMLKILKAMMEKISIYIREITIEYLYWDGELLTICPFPIVPVKSMKKWSKKDNKILLLRIYTAPNRQPIPNVSNTCIIVMVKFWE